MLRRLSLGASILACLSFSGRAPAQAGPSPSPSPASNPGEDAAPAASAPTVVIQQAPTGGTAYGPVFGPSLNELNQGLPSSSRTRTGDERDGFDLGVGSRGPSVVFGNKGAAGVLGPQRPIDVPPIHVVRKGDTLWDLCDTYYSNPWGWPKVWSYNPQIVNPHWIYPGDQLRLRDPNDPQTQQRVARADAALFGPGAAGKRGLPQSTVVLRDRGFLGDPKRDVWGEIAGAVEDQMLLSAGNHVYMTMRPGVELQPGQTLTIFSSLGKPLDVEGARKPPGEIVSVKGSIKIDQYNPKTRVARGEVVESLDVIERGYKVGPVGQKFDVVPPKPAARAVKARVLSGIYPHNIMGQHQLTFLDRGSEDGLEPGMRLFVLRQGDSWRSTLKSGNSMLKYRLKIESPEASEVERTPIEGDEKQFPTEILAELRVLRAEKFSSVAIVLETRRELEPGDVATTLPGK